MPSIMQYLNPNEKGRPGTTMLTGTERDERRQAYELAVKFYDGNHPGQLDVKEYEPNDNAVINLFQQSIDRIIAFLFPTMPELELDPDANLQTPDEEWLEAAWAANGGISLLHEMAMFGALSGHVYVRVMQPDPAEGDEYPQIIPLDPAAVVTYWRADDIRRVVWHEVRWSVDRDEFILDVVNNREGKNWLLNQYARTGGGGWDLVSSEVWNSPYGPIVHWKHLPNPGRFYGKAETDNLDLNMKVNLVASENNRIIRYHSSPKTIATGAQAGDIQRVGTDELWTVENENANIQNLEMRSDLSAAREHEMFLVDNYLSERRVVILRGDVADFQRVTNAGVRTVFMDMLSKNSILRWNYGTALREISRRLLWVHKGDDTQVPNVNHADPLPVDETEAVNVAAIERSMGVVSRETIATKRRYVWPVEVMKMKKEKESGLFDPIMLGPSTDEPKPTDNNSDE